LAIAALFVRSSIAQDHEKAEKSSSTSSNAATAAPAETHDAPLPQSSLGVSGEERMARLEGEKRFRANCGRCHQPPHKFPPRVMAAAIRHMRVRAMLTDEDMRLILKYMTQ
jgi:mono/diheme cytochrome c family protein